MKPITVHAAKTHLSKLIDRMLIVQAQAEGVPIASNETIFDDYGVTRLW